jgi:hypothetical protein
MTPRSAAALACLTLGACSAAHMALPADVAQVSEQLPIVDRSSWSGSLADETFKLGPYAIQKVDRKWNSTQSSSMFGERMSNTTGGYTFELSGEALTLAGTCATEARERNTNLGNGFSVGATFAKLGCGCSDSAGSADLVLDSSATQHYEGMLKSSAGEYHVSSINEREGGSSSYDPTGYRVDAGDGPKGAVDVLGTGRVWLSKALEARQRAEIACVFAGLLLYQPPRER